MHVKLLVKYNSNVPFETIKTIVRDNFRASYERLELIQDNEAKLDIYVDESFRIVANRGPNNETFIRTNKIKTNMNVASSDVDSILDVFKNIKQDAKSMSYDFEESDFTVYLDLPFQQTYAKFHTPKDVVIDNYELKMSNKTNRKHSSEVILKGHSIQINSEQKDDLLATIKRFTGII